MKRTFSVLILTLLLASMLAAATNIRMVKASGTIYIRADGSIDPLSAPIQRNGNYYTLTGNIIGTDGIVVQKSNVIIDGASYTLQGMGVGFGFNLTSINLVTIKNTRITHFYHGIWLVSSSNNSFSDNNIANSGETGILLSSSSSNNTISGNSITSNNWNGIVLSSSSNNSVSGNIISNNSVGVYLYSSSNNSIYHNSFVNNTHQIQIYTYGSESVWDDGYPSGGNYWSDHTGTDSNGDGIGDTPYFIDSDNQDRYPLMHSWSSLPIHNLNTGLGYATIQGAINAPETLDGHTIFAETGTYYENVVVNKTICLIGEDRSTTVIDGMQKGHVINVAINGVTITGFAITNSSLASSDSGIYLCEIDGCNITQNNVINNNIGVFLEWASNNDISSNNIAENSWCGIYLSYSSNNNVISSNNLESNNWYGIGLLWSSDINDINGNNITKNYYGIGLGDGSSYNAISSNNITNNLIGVGLTDNSSNNTISGNNIEANNQYGVYFYFASNNKLYHNNFIGNPWQVYDASYMLPGVTPSTNIWDDGFEGSYWGDYNGTDSNGDGIGDTPYVIDVNNTDYYPLMNRYWIPADVNHDLKINIFDVVKITGAYGATPASPFWNPHADIAEPFDKIDILDVVLCTGHYGEKYP